MDNEERRDNSQIMHSIGQLTGAVQSMHQGLTARIEDIKGDIRRLERAGRTHDADRGKPDRPDRPGARGRRNKRIDGLGTRVTALENEDKKLIEKTAKLSAVGGGVGGALAAAAVEIIKRI